MNTTSSNVLSWHGLEPQCGSIFFIVQNLMETLDLELRFSNLMMSE